MFLFLQKRQEIQLSCQVGEVDLDEEERGDRGRAQPLIAADLGQGLVATQQALHA